MNTIRRIKPIRESRRVEGNTVKVSTLMKGLLIFTLACLASAAAIYGNTITGVTDVNSTNIIYSPTYCNATVCKELSAWDTNTGGATPANQPNIDGANITTGIIPNERYNNSFLLNITDTCAAGEVYEWGTGCITTPTGGGDNATIDAIAVNKTGDTMTGVLNMAYQGLTNVYQQKVTVAKAGGDYTQIQAAINNITDANSTHRYAVSVAPGDYTENIVMKDYVDLVGSGRTNSRIYATTGTALTFPATKGTVQDMGIVVDYGTLGAESSAVVSGGADSIMLRCDVGVTKSDGDYQMHSFSITGGSFRMLDSHHTYSITGATTDTQLTQSAIEQNGALTQLLLYNSEITMTCDDTNDDLVGFETTTGGAGTYLLTGNIINLQCGAACTSATGLWLYGTATGATISRNRITIDCDSTSYGLWIDSDSGGAVVNTRHNEMVITSAGTAASGHTDTGDTWNSAFDKILAKSGYNGTGTTNMVSSQTPGNMTVTGILDVYNISLGAGYPSCNLDTDANGNLICGVDTAAGVGIAVELTNTGAGGRIDTNESFGIGFNVSNGSLIVGEGLFMFLGNESRIHHTTNNTIKIDENLNVTGNITTQELADCNAIGGDANGMLTCGSLSVVQNFTCRYPTIDYNMPSAAWDNATNYYIVAPATARYRILASGVVRATSVDTGGAGTGFKLQLADNGVPYAYTLRSGWTKSEYWIPFNLEWTADITTGHNITLQAQYFFTGGYELLANSTHSKPYICLIRLTT